MPSQDKLFLASSVDSSNALTELFDFVWPTSVALWNLQWQVKGFVEQMPNVTVEDLNSRFVLGSGIQGANLKRLANEMKLSEMQQWFARIILSETCALFEGWIEAALDELHLPQAIRQAQTKQALDKKLQFPTTGSAAAGYTNGVMFAVAKIRGMGGSPVIQTCFHHTQLQNKKHSLPFLEKLLICYRAFKEIRNDFTHHGGLVSQKAEQAFGEYHAETPISLGLKEMPELPNAVAGTPILLSLRGVVGFGDVAIRLIATLDYLLADSSYAEGALRRRWLAKHLGRVTVKPAGPKRNHQLGRLIKQCGLPRPINPDFLYSHLNAQGLAV